MLKGDVEVSKGDRIALKDDGEAPKGDGRC